jgi:hypothetical protein
MSAEVQLSSLVPLLNVDQSEQVVTEIVQCVETQILGQKMLNCIESQIVGHELGPVVAFSDLLELGADCTVLGDDYINEHGKTIYKENKAGLGLKTSASGGWHMQAVTPVSAC